MGFYHTLTRIFLWMVGLFFSAAILVATYVYFQFARTLPDVDSLKDVQLQVPLRVYSRDGKLMGLFGHKRRDPVSIDKIPDQLIHAVLATEDQRFFTHPGVDLVGLLRAAKAVAIHRNKAEGGSTITMQVARNFFLTRKKTYARKINEILLAIRIDRTLSKTKILELYLNKIYFGNRAYGVSAASHIYYGKPLAELTLAQMAMIAGLPKAPSALNPLADPEAAMKRRNHVLSRMYGMNYIDRETYFRTIAEPLSAQYHGAKIELYAPFITEVVRKAMMNRFGDDTYAKGFKVYTTVDSRMQNYGQHALQTGLLDFEKRHGYQGPRARIPRPSRSLDETQTQAYWLAELKKIPKLSTLESGVVTKIGRDNIDVMLNDGRTVTVQWRGLSWARRHYSNRAMGPQPRQPAQIVRDGDVVELRHDRGFWELSQSPKVAGALVALNPNDGSVAALVGGFDYASSKFDRATQAQRQMGSVIKPFIYSAALNKGYTLAHIINDAPIVIEDTGARKLWRPKNVSGRFYGPTRLRIGLIKSRNLVSIRLLRSIGVNYAVDFLSRFGFDRKRITASLSLALGTSEFTPLDVATGYAVFANGGYKVRPYIIDHIENSDNKVIFRTHTTVACSTCLQVGDIQARKNSQTLSAQAPRVLSPQNAYLITSALRDVIKRGTARRALALNREDIAGKTGTTNDQFDAWFSGYNADLVATVWVGYDQPASLEEYGSQAALPIWMDFMRNALANQPEHSQPEPPGLVTLRIDKRTGRPANPWQRDTTFELFRTQHTPHGRGSHDSSFTHDDGNEAIQQLF